MEGQASYTLERFTVGVTMFKIADSLHCIEA